MKIRNMLTEVKISPGGEKKHTSVRNYLAALIIKLLLAERKLASRDKSYFVVLMTLFY